MYSKFTDCSTMSNMSWSTQYEACVFIRYPSRDQRNFVNL